MIQKQEQKGRVLSDKMGKTSFSELSQQGDSYRTEEGNRVNLDDLKPIGEFEVPDTSKDSLHRSMFISIEVARKTAEYKKTHPGEELKRVYHLADDNNVKIYVPKR